MKVFSLYLCFCTGIVWGSKIRLFQSDSGVTDIVRSTSLLVESSFLNQIQEIAKRTSSCVPNNTIYLTLSNTHHISLTELQVERVSHEICLMKKWVQISLDANSFFQCKKRCAQIGKGRNTCTCFLSKREYGSSDFKKNHYEAIIYSKLKFMSKILKHGVNVVLFDADVKLYSVPTLPVFTNHDLYFQYDYLINGGQIYSSAKPEVVVFFEDVLQLEGKTEKSDQAVMYDMLNTNKYNFSHGFLSDKFGSACWIDPTLGPGSCSQLVTYHANCNDNLITKLKTLSLADECHDLKHDTVQGKLV